MPSLRRPTTAAAVAMGGTLLTLNATWQAFVPAARGGPDWQPALRGDAARASVAAAASAGRVPSSSAPAGGFGRYMGAAAFAAVAAAAASRRSAGRQSKAASVVLPQSGIFAGSTLPQSQLSATEALEPSETTMQSMKSCSHLWFIRPYEGRRRKELRNRAYNIFMMRRYKKSMRPPMRYCRSILNGEIEVESLEAMMGNIKEDMTYACMTIDEVCVQGVIKSYEAGLLKDRMFKLAARVAIRKGFIEKPEDPLTPAFELIGFDVPKSFKLREPRPWQLPGYKSPYMLKKEFDAWVAKKKAEA